MSGGSKQTQQQTQQQTSTNTLDPEFKGLVMDNYAGAQARAGSMLPYTGQLTAGFTPTQIAAQNKVAGIANDPTYGATNNSVIGAVSGVMNNPVAVGGAINGTIKSNPVTSSNVTAGMLADTDLTPYLNPYTNSVINTTISDNERAREIQQAADARTAAAAGAFGGSRSGVAAAQTNEAYDRNTASLLAGLNQANYTNAQGAASTDIGNRLTADTLNANNKLTADQFNSGQDLTAQQNSFANNLAADNQYFTQGVTANNQTLDAANGLLGASNNALTTATNQAGLLSSVGDAQQAQNQTELSNAYAAWSQGQQLTLEQQQMLNAALGLVPAQQTVTSSGNSNGTTQTSSSGGLTGILGGLGSLAMGLGKNGLGAVI